MGIRPNRADIPQAHTLEVSRAEQFPIVVERTRLQQFGSPEVLSYPTVQHVLYPSSYDALPRLSAPDRSEIARVEEIKRSIVRKAGIGPGTYTKIADDLYASIEDVYNNLVNALRSELAGVDAFDLCIRLYERNEVYLGNIYSSHFARATRRSVSGIAEPSIPSLKLWEQLSPYTESIRWLVEVTLKFCKTTGDRVTARKFDRLVELARAVLEWDMMWEHVYREVIPHDINIDSDFTVTAQPTPRAYSILKSYRTALAPNAAEQEQEEFEKFQSPVVGTSPHQTIEVLESLGLDPALTSDQGYSMSDWAKFVFGLIDSFAADEFRRVIKLAGLNSFLSQKWDLDSDRLPHLLRDFGLSRETVRTVEIDGLRPAEHGRRDSRLMRRPVVILDRGGSLQCLYGVETTSRASLMTLRRLESGRIDLVRRSENKDLMRAVGKLQVELGKVFERNIAEKCKSMGYQCQSEKDRIRGTRIPQGKNFGPVDVFVVDRTHKRFVLVEAKNIMDEGVNPKEMAKERKRFTGYISKLNSQVEWFGQRLSDLQAEYSVSTAETYSVEGVIVVNNPRLWMFTYDEPVPILDWISFFRRLAGGRRFTVDPVSPA